MYTDFYSLREKPFNLTPSPRFLYLGESHKEALALLRYGIMERKGFVLLTGEVGTGKTTIVQALLKSLDKNIQLVHLSNPLMEAQDFINYLGFQALGRTEHYRSKAEFLLEFESFLRACRKDQRNFVLIIDEAQSLSYAVLEEIRLLSNMESAEEKLINIFLVGQPELNEKLSDPRCRPLLQRISIRHHISPLRLQEARGYIITRLETAGAREPKEIFSKEVIEAIYRYSNGYPRMINVLADNSLLLGYSKRIRKITPGMVMESYQDLQLEGSILKAKEGQSKEGEDGAQGPLKRKINWKWVAAAFLLGMGIATFLMIEHGKGGMVRFTGNPSGRAQSDSLRQDEDKVVVRKKLPDNGGGAVLEKSKEIRQALPPPQLGSTYPISSLPPKVEQGETFLKPNAAKRSDSPLAPVPEERGDPHDPKSTGVVLSLPPKVKQGDMPLTPNSAERSEATLSAIAHRSVIVKEGDTIAKLAATIYGRFDREVLGWIKDQNPVLVDENRIMAGQEIIFPEVVNSRKKVSGVSHQEEVR